MLEKILVELDLFSVWKTFTKKERKKSVNLRMHKEGGGGELIQ